MPHSILIVEDDLTFATMLKTWLGKKGFSVDTASSNARARKQLDAQPYDLVLSDLRLPDQDGIFLLSWMKEQKYNIPLIIMTGYADIQSAVQAIKHGASDYISKPVQPDELLKKINEALQNKALPTPAGIEKNTVTPKASKSKAVPHSATVPPSNFLEGESEAARQLYNYVGLVAPTPMSELINAPWSPEFHDWTIQAERLLAVLNKKPVKDWLTFIRELLDKNSGNGWSGVTVCKQVLSKKFLRKVLERL